MKRLRYERRPSRRIFRFFVVLWCLLSVHSWKFRFPGRRRGDENRGGPMGGGDNSKNEPTDVTKSSASDTTDTVVDEPPAGAPFYSTDLDTDYFQEYCVRPMKGVAQTIFGESRSLVDDIAASVDEAAEAAQEQISKPPDEQRLFPFPPFVLPKLVEFWTALSERLHAIVLYKPPVGIVALTAALRLIATGRLFRLYQAPKDSVEDALQQQSRKRETDPMSRALYLDPYDTEYSSFGGIEHTRRRLCSSALSAWTNSTSGGVTATTTPLSLEEQQQQLIQEIVDALDVTSTAGAARILYVQDMISPISLLERTLTDHANLRVRLPATASTDMTPEQVNRIVSLSSTTAQVRMMDALLRVCRDRLLLTCHRLARSQQHWKKRVMVTSQSMPPWMQRLLRKSVEGNRIRLSYATAAYNAEIRRLGDIATILLQRPIDESVDSDNVLLRALKATRDEDKASRQEAVDSNGEGIEVIESLAKLSRPKKKRRFLRRWSFPKTYKYSLSWKAPGSRSLLSIRKLDSASEVSSASALEALLSEPADAQQAWIEQTQSWMDESRETICRVLTETLQGTITTDTFNSDDFAAVEREWCTHRYGKDTDIEDEWRTVVRYVDSLQNWRRIGEGKAVRLKDAAIVKLGDKLDVFGIFPSLLWVGAAYGIHVWFEPRWAEVKSDFLQVVSTVELIVRQRIVEPAVAIWNDLTKPSTGMMSALSVQDEQDSLNLMLRDMNFGDGTEATQQEALRKATEEYAHDLDHLFVNVARGKLVRLLLLQVQQLKVGVLSALETVDKVMLGNKLNFQLLAAIPAVLFLNYGTRVIARALFRLRSPDLRPITAVHSEMTEYLGNMKDVMLLTDDECFPQGQQQRGRRQSSRSSPAVTVCWTPDQVGELLLQMYRYLVLLDFSSPPVASWRCDDIQESLQELLSERMQRLQTPRQIEWLRHIQEKNQDLLKKL